MAGPETLLDPTLPETALSRFFIETGHTDLVLAFEAYQADLSVPHSEESIAAAALLKRKIFELPGAGDLWQEGLMDVSHSRGRGTKAAQFYICVEGILEVAHKRRDRRPDGFEPDASARDFSKPNPHWQLQPAETAPDPVPDLVPDLVPVLEYA